MNDEFMTPTAKEKPFGGSRWWPLWLNLHSSAGEVTGGMGRGRGVDKPLTLEIQVELKTPIVMHKHTAHCRHTHTHTRTAAGMSKKTSPRITW